MIVVPGTLRVLVAAMLSIELPALCETPDVQAVQQAYDAAKGEPEAQKQHVYELLITNAKCSQPAQSRYHVCQVDFVRRDEPQGRLYFDVITMQSSQGRWQLLSGLCKGRPPVR